MPDLVQVVATGPLALLQDEGRPGWAAVGVGRSGAADRRSYALANRIVGNEPGAAAIEAMMGGLRLRALRSVTVAVTGAHAPATVNGRPGGHATPLYLTAGDELALGLPTIGLRSYVAVAGGIAVEPVLGSRSTDTMSGLGPERLAAGQLLPVGAAPPPPRLARDAVVSPLEGGTLHLAVIAGPRDDWVGGLEELTSRPWSVSSRCDRIGVRLEGTPLARATDFEGRELPSEGVVRGAIQVPAGGLPVLFLNDHPVTGGYPVVGVLPERESDRVAQARPGQQVRFRVHQEGR